MKIRFQILIILAFFCLGCSSVENDQENEMSDNNVLDTIPVSTSNQIENTKFDSIPTISGSCENGREIGDLKYYQVKMKVGKSSSDSINVRSNAASFEHGNLDNVLGKIKSGTIVFVQGPLKNRAFSAGVGYSFPVKDKNGNICKGYLSYLNLEEIETTPNTGL